MLYYNITSNEFKTHRDKPVEEFDFNFNYNCYFWFVYKPKQQTQQSSQLLLIN